MSELLPKEWSWVPLGDLAEVVSGGTPSKNEPAFWDGGTIPWATPSDITKTPGRVILETGDKITDLGLSASAARKLPVGSVLMTSRATLGEARVAGVATATNQGFKSLIPKAGVDNWYLFYQIQNSKSRYSVFGKGTTFLEVNTKDTLRLPIPHCPLPQQRRIATILTTLDEVIEATEKLVEKQQQIKAGLMHDLFTRGLWTREELARGDHKGTAAEASANEGQLRPTLEEAPGLYQGSPLGLIPKAWKPGLLSDYLDPINGIKPGPFGSSLTKDIFTSSGFRVYGQEQVISGNLEIGDYYISPHKFAEMRAFEVLEGDVLLSLVGTVGCVLIVEAPFEPGIINPRLLRLRPLLGNASPYFVRYLLLTDGLRKQIDSLAGGGTMPVINGKIIRRLRIPVISPEEQKLIVTRLQSLEQSVTTTTTHLAKLRQQKQGLMHDLLTGRVRVE